MQADFVKFSELGQLKSEALAVGVFLDCDFAKDKNIKQIDALTDGAFLRYVSKNPKFGKVFESVHFHISPAKHKNIEKVLFVGLGKEGKLANYKLRQTASHIGKNRGPNVSSLALFMPAGIKLVDNLDLITLGFSEGLFDPGHHKTGKGKDKKEFKKLTIVAEVGIPNFQNLVKKGLAISESIAKVREAVNQPANVVTPEYLVSFAKKIALAQKLKIEVFSEKQVVDMGMGIMASVAKGSDLDLYFVVLRYMGAGSLGPTIAFVGKGITFDSGGLSLKPGELMDWMKMDMAGAASCFGAIEAISKIGAKVNVIVACPLTENLPSGKASKPGDVVMGLSGKTVEIINTDAEGRLVLSDALTYVQKNFKPDYIVDVATLTGAVVVALGNLATGVMGRPQEFIDDVIKAGDSSGERLWQLPLYDEYRDMIKSYIADIANLSSVRGAGAETAAKFLEDFVDKDQKWAHLDIASTAWEESEKGYAAKGATGASVSTLVELALKIKK